MANGACDHRAGGADETCARAEHPHGSRRGAPEREGTSAIPGAASGLGSTAPATPSAGFGANLATFCQKCKAKLCASQFGQMLRAGHDRSTGRRDRRIHPVDLPAAGHDPGRGRVGAQPGSAAAAAAAIQASEANAKARVAAIEYLGTVDCARWPEAKAVLINGLRKDTNECVRFAAARALNSGCCCDKKVIDALGSASPARTTDDAPAENSFRVKAAAFSALQNCLMKVPEELPPETKPPLPEGDRPNLVPLPPAPENPAHVPAANPRIAASYNPQRRRTITYDDQLHAPDFRPDRRRRCAVLCSRSRNVRAPHPRSRPGNAAYSATSPALVMR